MSDLTDMVELQFHEAVNSQSVSDMRRLCSEHPWLKSPYRSDGDVLRLSMPVQRGYFISVQALLEIGIDPNALAYPTKSRTSILCQAISCKQVEIASLLINHGANPNLDRPLIAAINHSDDELAMRCVRLLVENGVDVNQVFLLYDDPNNTFTALDWAKSRPAIVQYLRENGAKTAEELKAQPAPKKRPAKAKTPAQEVIDHFTSTVGPVDEKSLIEIIPTGQPITVHAIPSADSLQHLTLFTTGLSDQSMTVPDGEEDFALAELFIELPGDWDYHKFKVAKWNWPMRWLRQIAQYPSANDTWLKHPITIIANGNPAKPIIPGTIFTCLLLVPEKSFERSDFKTVQLYRVLPITTAERDLERAKGAKALMRALDKVKVPFVVDVNRESVV